MMQIFSKTAARLNDESDLVGAILRERPDLQGKDVSSPRQGVDGHTVFIGNEVFKAPRSKRGIRRFDKELELLGHLQGKDMRVPAITCVGKESLFYGMTRMPGVELRSGVFMENEDIDALVCDIVDFMIDMARAAPKKRGKFVRHGDMHAGNILVDPKTKRLTAVIDFARVNYRSEKRLARYYFYESDFLKKVQQAYKRRYSLGCGIQWGLR